MASKVNLTEAAARKLLKDLEFVDDPTFDSADSQLHLHKLKLNLNEKRGSE
jgi:hypothetical protein